MGEESTDSIGITISQFLTNVNVDDAKAAEISTKIAQLIEAKKLKLLELVKALGDYLTADDDLLRPKATLCLSYTIQSLQKSSLLPNDIQVLNGFFISKLEDIKSVKEALVGISSLIDQENYGTSLIKPLLVAIKDDYDSKSHLASTRYLTFEILEKLFLKFEKYLVKFITAPFIETFIHIASGEKDPKNLLKSFTLNSQISKSFEIRDYQDDLFDILFCYFPISFKPPKDDPYKITSEDLKSALRNAIASSPSFAKDSYPNLLEKLSSTSPSVKKDTLQTILACVDNYGPDSILEFWVELWNGLKFEILHGDQDDDEEKIFPLVLSIFKSISVQLSNDEENFKKFWDVLSEELQPNFKNPKSIKQTCAIYGSIASSNPSTFNIVTEDALNELFQCESHQSTASQRQLIKNLGYFTSAYSQVFPNGDSDYNTLLDFKDEILVFLGKSLMGASLVEVSLRTLAITELTKLTTLNGFLAESELSLIVQYFTESVLIDDNEYVFNSGIGGLLQISKINSKLLLEVTFPTLLSLLPEDESSNVIINGQEKPREKVFQILSQISITRELCDNLVIRLTNLLSEIGLRAANVNYSYTIASTLKTVIETSQRNSPFSTDSYLKTTFGKLVSLLITSSTQGQSSVYDDAVLEIITDVLKLFVTYSNKSLHQELSDESIKVFVLGDGKYLKYFHDVPLDSQVLKTPTKLINIFVKVLAGVDNSVKLSIDLISNVIEFVERNDIKDHYTKIGYLQLIALLINKWDSDSSRYLRIEIDSMKKIEIFTWITKGVILKNDHTSEGFIDKLVQLLKTKELGLFTTRSFEILVIDLSIFDKFKKISNNNVRLLYKQKLFQIVSPKLVDHFTNCDDLIEKSNYLTALSYILKHTSKDVIKPHLSSFFPLLLQALSLPNSDVRYASVKTLLSSVDEIPELITKHLNTLISSLLQLIIVDEHHLNNPDVRLISLNCLQSLTFTIPLAKLIPFQHDILKRSIPVLDDKRRKVRKGAVDMRQAYFELGRSPIE